MRYAGVALFQPDPQPSVTEMRWTMIGIDDPSDGWSVAWDTRGAEPRPWWVQVTVTDSQGHSDSDAVELWVAGRLGARCSS